MDMKRLNVLDHSFLGIAVIFVVLAVIGGYQHYTPIPFWDMWDGYVRAPLSFDNWGVWWAQHNEHRILLSRLFFYADLNYFNGASWFLIIVNYVLVGCVAFIFWLIWREQSQGKNQFVGFFLIAWSFYWTQKPNFTWAFQSQFIMAQLLPLVSFYLLHKSISSLQSGRGFFCLAAVVGVLSGWTMINGIITLPLMVIYAFVVGASGRRIIVLAVLGALNAWWYFHDFYFPPGHYQGSFIGGILENPVVFLHYIVVYAGSPFYHITSGGVSGMWIARIMGVLLIVGSGIFTILELRKGRQSTLTLMLLLFILYIGGTMVGTAGGRLIFGVENALAERYQTPALMAWAALFTIVATRWDWNRRLLAVLFFVLIGLMWDEQHSARKAQPTKHLEQGVAMLAVELGIKDEQQIATIYPIADKVLNGTIRQNREDISIFGIPPYKGLREKWRVVTDYEQGKVSCQTSLGSITKIPEAPDYLRIEGVIEGLQAGGDPDYVELVNRDRQIVGFAIPSQVARNSKMTSRLEYKGYMDSASVGKPFVLLGDGFRCSAVKKL